MKTNKSIFAIILALSLGLIWGCKKDSNAGNTNNSGTYKVKFVGTFSAGSTINTATILYGSTNKSFTSLSGTSWTKELELTESDLRATSGAVKNIAFGLQGTGKDANATGTVEIFVNDVSVRKTEGKGSVLFPNVTYNF